MKDFLDQDILEGDLVITGQNLFFTEGVGFQIYEVTKLTKKNVKMKKHNKPKSKEIYKNSKEIINLRGLKEHFPEAFI